MDQIFIPVREAFNDTVQRTETGWKIREEKMQDSIISQTRYLPKRCQARIRTVRYRAKMGYLCFCIGVWPHCAEEQRCWLETQL
jgi:hypothetical protein